MRPNAGPLIYTVRGIVCSAVFHLSWSIENSGIVCRFWPWRMAGGGLDTGKRGISSKIDWMAAGMPPIAIARWQ